ncbi:PilZ domain-containing protein [Ureibacillus endophyticus]|uniref:PilZ domain-containing protein n=1 Tax=Ureibacillus endophyticus TaxID=1978490 RepID=A0A494Z6J8_9BACL|nr:PilZ domain-containing protein [Lysinibacillus endophyticus]RKQ18139.1 PilZ domain-containing protein [Lysinibacillus endophyticus]
MNFKRKEGFRFVFNEPIEATYGIYINDKPVNIEKYNGKILDISPRGMKLFCGPEIEKYLNDPSLQVEIQFVLDVTTIRAIGDIVWSKPLGAGFQCGVVLTVQEDVDELIISEMKRRRKKEVLQSKHRKY